MRSIQAHLMPCYLYASSCLSTCNANCLRYKPEATENLALTCNNYGSILSQLSVLKQNFGGIKALINTDIIPKYAY